MFYIIYLKESYFLAVIESNLDLNYLKWDSLKTKG